MLDSATKNRIDKARDVLVGKVPDPKSQVEQITLALIYKFMHDMDQQAERLGGKATFFVGKYKKYAWTSVYSTKIGGHELIGLYGDALAEMQLNPNLPPLFRDIFKNAFLPYRDPETLRLFLSVINEFSYDHSEMLGDAYEYLLSVLGSQGDAGQFRTPRHIIDFIVQVVGPMKTDRILDPACGTAGFLIAAFKYILKTNTNKREGDLLTTKDRKELGKNLVGYDISPDMVRMSLVNLYLHGFADPAIQEYDTLTSEDRWDDKADVIMANPPFMSPKGGIRPHGKFRIAASRSEVLFVDYILEHLTPQGKAGIIVPEGIIFQSGNAYKDLRKWLVDEHLLYAVVSLPAGVFQPYSGVKTSILFIDKEIARRSEHILFVKIGNDGFEIGAQRRPTPEKDELPSALEVIKEYKTKHVIPAKAGIQALLVPKEKITASGDYNLSMDRYRDAVITGNERWPRLKLEELVTEMKSGFASGNSEKETGDVIHLRPMNITSKGELTFEGSKYISRSEAKPEYTLKADDVLFNNTNSKELVGKTCLIDKDYDAVYSNHMTRIRVERALLSPRFLAYVLHYLFQSGYFLAKCNKWVGQAGINLKSLGETEIPLPPLPVQEALVAELERYRKMIEGARAILANYKPEIEIDPKWEIVQLSQVCKKFDYGISEALNTDGVGYKTFRMNEIVNGRTVDNGSMKCADITPQVFKKYQLRREDILFNRTNSIEHVGRTGIFELDGDYIAASYLVRLIPDKLKVDPHFLNFHMNLDWWQKQLKTKASRAIGQANISASLLAKESIYLPPLAEQQTIVARLEQERAEMEMLKGLVARMEGKIKARVAGLWGE
ncbi:MAG: N-6 DNA methylase [Bacteroidota bacterium]|nr:N-6 DNA methylase [Bacteroidota bacterium]MDP4234118.1 N-6 DNA methylase [Bacteroidota bacterium]MDP4243059.1 N-6 DNA methylase [Bacteroidota bacterium]MDP4287485.1 N-6 DNA methylase [Bacteroidota bacterium]